MSSSENLHPRTLRKIMVELKKLTTKPPEGVRVIPNEEDVTEVNAILVGQEGTPYQGGHFHMRLKLGSDYPRSPPKGFFLTKIFHPNVSETGEICVNTLKRDWKESHGIEHILLTVKCLLIVPNAESALNEEAGRMLLEEYDDYAQRARLWTKIHAAPQDGSGRKTSSSSSSSGSSSSGSSSSSSSGSVSGTKRAAGGKSPVKKRVAKGKTTGAGGVRKKAPVKKKSLKRL
eukprot:TRINITY_DN654_c1_g1_i1.p1 TRINITY_DN654_c1_g1~~TRINITY_DN654_c1_g1_i1.p1  ORF type:complete len:246 (+),score=65.85 TRINITY_DN654_c1_g1_i1:48-740(+)